MRRSFFRSGLPAVLSTASRQSIIGEPPDMGRGRKTHGPPNMIKDSFRSHRAIDSLGSPHHGIGQNASRLSQGSNFDDGTSGMNIYIAPVKKLWRSMGTTCGRVLAFKEMSGNYGSSDVELGGYSRIRRESDEGRVGKQ